MEEPRLAYGPEAADWLEQYYDETDPNTYIGLMQPPEWYREQICSLFLLVHVQDFGEPSLLRMDTTCAVMDVKYTDGTWFPQYPGVPWGAGIWIDHEPYKGEEYVSWYDPNIDPMAEDGKPWGEEFIVIFEMDSILLNPELESVKVRVTDFRDNWRRSDELDLGDFHLHTVQDLIFRDERYPMEGDPCEGQQRRESCDGYVEDRTGGEATLDVAALVCVNEGLVPPLYVTAFISAPLDTPNSTACALNTLEVPLYRLDPEHPSWAPTLQAFMCETGSVPGCFHIYCRGDGVLDINGEPIDPPPALAIASDQH